MSLDPRSPYTEEELAKLYPSTLELHQVQIVHRHGERSPVSPRFQEAGLTPYWPYCTTAKKLKSIVMLTPDGKEWDDLQWRRRLEILGHHDTPVLGEGPGREVDTICLPGETTDKGRTTTYALGQRLRHLYVDQLGFLPKTLESTSDFYLRCTMIPRALDAMQQSFSGLYPASTRAASLEPPIIHARNWAEENLTDNERTCKRYGMLYKAFGERAAGRWNDSPEMAYINQKIGRYMPEESPTVKIDGHPRLSGIMDTINATRAHGPATRLPKEFYDPQVVADIEKMVTEEWFAGCSENEEFRRLGKGQMIGDVTAKMVNSALGRSKEPIRFALTGAHDTTLAGFLASVGAFEGEGWPNFTSSMAVELFRKKSRQGQESTAASKSLDSQPPASPRTSWFTSLFGSSASPKAQPTSSIPDTRKPLADFSPSERETIRDYYVRIRYNDKPVTIPGCKKPGRHLAEAGETFCTLEAFKQIADVITPRDWKKECLMRLDEKVDISRKEPAGYPAGEGT